jgi:hypothetical protein
MDSEPIWVRGNFRLCLLAYYIGAKLSFFQVAFVNICFFVMNAVANLSLLNAFRRLEYIADNLSDVAIQAMPVTVIPVGAVLTFDAFLVIGCYAFMWSVRHDAFLVIGCYAFMWSVRHSKD